MCRAEKSSCFFSCSAVAKPRLHSVHANDAPPLAAAKRFFFCPVKPQLYRRGHNYIGHNYIGCQTLCPVKPQLYRRGHNYIGHNYRPRPGEADRKKKFDRPSVCVVPPPALRRLYTRLYTCLYTCTCSYCRCPCTRLRARAYALVYVCVYAYGIRARIRMCIHIHARIRVCMAARAYPHPFLTSLYTRLSSTLLGTYGWTTCLTSRHEHAYRHCILVMAY